MATIKGGGARHGGTGRREPAGLKVRPWNFLLLLPLLGVLIPPMYNMRDPQLWSIPFFYWWQLLWVPITMVVTILVTRQTGDRR